jgi:hypothetical protein
MQCSGVLGMMILLGITRVEVLALPNLSGRYFSDNGYHERLWLRYLRVGYMVRNFNRQWCCLGNVDIESVGLVVRITEISATTMGSLVVPMQVYIGSRGLRPTSRSLTNSKVHQLAAILGATLSKLGVIPL